MNYAFHCSKSNNMRILDSEYNHFELLSFYLSHGVFVAHSHYQSRSAWIYISFPIYIFIFYMYTFGIG